MAEHAESYGIVVKHAEDEISVVNMAIGAGHMGVRSMCATSGGGFALMNEGYGLAAITETPVLIVLVQRPGPATGLPTWTGQGDLQYALHAAQGEFPRFVLAPGDVSEAFYMTAEALNVAEEYQSPVLLLSDKQLAESHETVPPFDQSKIEIRRGKCVTQRQLNAQKDFKRYDVSVEDGVSPRSFPGMKAGIFIANSDEHDEKGFTEESSENAIAMFQKRQRKFEDFKSKMSQPKLVGDKNADVTFVFWGSVKGAVQEAMKKLKEYKTTTNHLQITWLSPFPSETVLKILNASKRVLLVENNMDGQLGQLIREQTGFEIKEKILKYDGRPFFPEEIIEYINKE
jgi:2-oxoglutarate ferredoxin oxidoreductase subunit alpha